MPDLQPGRKALSHLKRVLEQRPKKDDYELTFATQCLAEFREELIEADRAASGTAKEREHLSRLNAIISVVMGMHFPLGNAPWGEFEKCLSWMAELVDDIEGRPAEQDALTAP